MKSVASCTVSIVSTRVEVISDDRGSMYLQCNRGRSSSLRRVV